MGSASSPDADIAAARRHGITNMGRRAAARQEQAGEKSGGWPGESGRRVTRLAIDMGEERWRRSFAVGGRFCRSMTIDKFEGPSVYFFRKIIGLMGTARPWTVPAWLFWPGHVTLAQRASTAQHGLRSGHGTTSTSEQKAETTVHKSQ
uniref:Uncharacterized protein n=1 Tax=Oryza barthii TaxID=65489 RepID=A0A0D3FYB1_9ORYZ